MNLIFLKKKKKNTFKNVKMSKPVFFNGYNLL